MHTRAINYFAKMALRTILFAYKDISKAKYEEIKDDLDELESNLTVLSIFGIRDIIRSEVPNAINTVKNAGI